MTTIAPNGPRIAIIYYAGGSGGTTYERQIFQVLRDGSSITEHSIVGSKTCYRFLQLPVALRQLRRAVERTSSNWDLVINTLDASLVRGRASGKSVVIVHHLDFSTNRYARIYRPLQGYILRCIRKADQVVAVSEFWKSYLQARGVERVDTIYNPFDVEQFQFKLDDISLFKRRMGLEGKPIVYLGARGAGKGVDEAHRCLAGLDVHFVATGSAVDQLTGLNVQRLPVRDYQLLLKASSLAITMSTFDEGWCRNTHEAMLCKTPVIGSGRGGMGELLSQGGQLICTDFGQLRTQVAQLLADPQRREQMGERGYEFARQFTLDRFKNDWLRLIDGTLGRRMLSIAM